jgi:hypothetical protein
MHLTRAALLPLARNRGFLTGEGLELGCEVLDVSGLGRVIEEFLDRGEEVVEGADGREWRS